MPSTDDRVVAMHFDNVAFERKVADTIASMDKLKTSLDLTHATKGLGDLKAAGHNFDLGGITSAIENVSSKFSAMGAVAFSVINNIVSRATDAGIQLGKSLSLNQIVSGFQEYETNMNSIQTIMANTRADGTSLEQVSAALEELNLYSDKTIYNFSQMARNIGTFTAAGVSLETSTGAIKGIANLAAVSGSNAEQASTAMYQLSQALASGSLKLMDWNSVVNAGMGGEVFQKALFETGKALGTIKDVPMDQTFEQWKDAGNTFRATLEQGWVTGEVLTNTLAGFTGDLTEAQLMSMGYSKEQAAGILEMGVVAQDAATKVKTLTQLIGTIKESIGSGWSQTFKIIFGDFEEARTLFTGFSEFFGSIVKKSSDARNKVLASWEKMGGRDKLIQSLMYAVKTLTDLLTPLKEAFREIFPKKTATDLYRITSNVRDFLRSLVPTEETLGKLKRIFLGLFSAIDIGIEIIKGIWGVFKDLFNALAGASDGKVLSFFAMLADKIVALRETLVGGKGIAHFFEDIGPKIVGFATTFINKIKEIYAAVKNFIGFFNDGFSGVGENEGEGIQLFANKFGMQVARVKDFIKELIEYFHYIDDAFKGAIMFKDADAEDFGPVKLARKLGEAWRAVKDFVSGAVDDLSMFKDKVVDFISNLTGGVTGDTGGGLFKKLFGDNADEDVKRIEGIGDKIGVAGDKLKAFRDKLTEQGAGGKTPGESLGEISSAMQDLQDKAGGFGGFADTLQGVWDRITSGIDGVKTKFEDFLSFIQGIVGGSEDAAGAATKSATKAATRGPKADDSVGKVSKGGGLDIDAGDAAAAGILGGILLIFRDLRKLIPDVKGLFKNVSKSVEEVTGVFEAMQLKLKAEALMEIGKAIALITASMVVLSLMDTGALITAASAVGVVVGQLVGAMALLSKFASGPAATGKLAVMAAGMVAMAGAVLIMSVAAKLMSTIDTAELVKGLGAISILLFALSISAGKIDKIKFKGGVGLILIAFALQKIADVVLIFGGMDLRTIAQGLGAVVVSLTLLSEFIDLLPNGVDLLRAGAGIALISVALNLMATAVKIFGTMGWEEMAKGLIGVAVSLGMMVIALKYLPTDIKVLAAAAALLIMSFALQTLATALGIIAALSTDDMTKSLVGLGIALGILAGAAYLMQSTVLGSAAIALISISLSGLAEALKLFADMGWGELLGGLAKLAVALGALALVAYLIAPAAVAIGALGLALVVLGAGFALLGAGIWLIGEGFQAIAEAGGKAVPVFMELVEGLIGLIPEFIGAVADGLLLLAKKILDAAPGLISAMTKVLSALLDAALELVPKFGEVISKFFVEMLRVAAEVVPEAIAAGFAFLMGLLHGIEDNIGEIVTTVANIITGFLDALALKLPQLIDSAYNFIKALVKGVIAKLGEIGLEFLPIGLSLLQGIWDGIWSGITWLVDQILGLFDPIIGAFKSMFGIASPSTVMAEIGLWLIEGLWNGISGAISWLLESLAGIITSIIGAFTGAITWLLDVGEDVIQGLWDGMIAVYAQLGEWLIALPGEILGFLGDAASWLLDWGSGVIQGLWDGAIAIWNEVVPWVTALPGKMLDFLGDALELMLNWGKDIIRGLWKGAKAIFELVTTWVTNLPGDILELLGDGLETLLEWGKDIIRGLWKGVTAIWELFNTYVIGLPGKILGWLGNALEILKEWGKDIIRGLWNGLEAMKTWIMDKIKAMVSWLTAPFEAILDLFSPSRVFMRYGQMIGQGLIIGIDDMQKPITKVSEAMGKNVSDSFKPDTDQMVNTMAKAMTSVANQLHGMEEFNPTITPVLDLSNVEHNAVKLGQILGSGSVMAATLTHDQAAMLAASNETESLASTSTKAPMEIKFEQNNYSPKALSTSDIYRQTRNQISMAKEALAVP